MKTVLVIYGAGGHASVVAGIARLKKFEILGFLDDVNTSRKGTEFNGCRVLGGSEQLPILKAQNISNVALAIGECAARMIICQLLLKSGFNLLTLVHPQAIVAPEVMLGPGTIMVAGSIVNPGCRVGSGVILNTASSIDHDCVVEDGVHIGPGARLGGEVFVGKCAWIGIGAVIRDKIRIGAGTIIGSGAVVVKDIPDGVVAYGVPARVIRPIGQK
jgi:sugar O-acyltransferase (sialic acid O-acetyltransferase NeuD family)